MQRPEARCSDARGGPSWPRRRVLAGLLTGASALRVAAQPVEAPFTGFKGTQVRFASVAVAASLLSADDDWIGATGDFQRRAVMGQAQPVSHEAFRRWNGEAARAWRDDARARWTRALGELAPAFDALRIPLPEVVHLVATSGRESANAPYTRGQAVMLPERHATAGADAALLAHELWHVASRHAPALASRLYAELGFQPMTPLRFPLEWQAIRIANPDAPNHAHAMRVQLAGQSVWVTPVLVAGRKALKPEETFFDVMDVRLLEVVPGSDGTASLPVRVDGQLRWHRLDAVPDYLRQLGGNTGYVIHPEEALAENVVLLASGARARNPALLDRLRSVLLQSRP